MVKLRHGRLLARSFRLPWEAKGLWVLGILFEGIGGGIGLFNRRSIVLLGLAGLAVALTFGEGGSAAPLLLLSALLVAGLWGLRTVVRAGLIRAVAAADGGEAVSWRRGLAWGWGPWARDHALQGGAIVLLSLPGLGLLLLSIFAVAQSSFGGSPGGLLASTACFFPASILVGLLDLALDVWLHLGRRAVVLEEEGPWTGLEQGGNLFRDHPGDVLLAAILSFGIETAGSLFVGGIAFPLWVLSLTLGTSLAARLPALGLGLIGLGGFLTLLLSAVPNGYLRTVLETYWTLAYRELAAARPSLPPLRRATSTKEAAP